MTKYVITEKGERREGGASPELLPEELRKLPSDYVTKEEDDPDRVHPLDAPHIVEAVSAERREKEEGTYKDPLEKPKRKFPPIAPVGRVIPLSQQQIDYVRYRALQSIITVELCKAMEGEDPDLEARYHLWFPEDNVNHYLLRDGNPPADIDRPKHLRGYRLELDMLHWPQSLVDLLSQLGIELSPDLRAELRRRRKERDVLAEMEAAH